MTAAAENHLMSVATTKLVKMLGETKGRELVARTLQAAGLKDIFTADDLRKFADELITKEGLVKMIGHSLRTEALLRGAGFGKAQ
ncbi:MAG: hypothetical protein QM817_00345 [Archangium sp.]